MRNVLVTGGLVSIGSHLVDALITQGVNVCLFDNLTAGWLQNIKQWHSNPNVTFIKGDLLNSADLAKTEKTSFETIFHLAANPKQSGLHQPGSSLSAKHSCDS
jgi:nucleoside-diphosphate-sugar epimerase